MKEKGKKKMREVETSSTAKEKGAKEFTEHNPKTFDIFWLSAVSNYI